MLIWLRYSGEFCRKVALILGLNHITTCGMYINVRDMDVWRIGDLHACFHSLSYIFRRNYITK